MLNPADPEKSRKKGMHASLAAQIRLFPISGSRPTVRRQTGIILLCPIDSIASFFDD